MIKLLITALALSILSGCATVEYESRPSHIKEITLEDGRVIQEYVVGYGVDDFKAEFYGYSKR